MRAPNLIRVCEQMAQIYAWKGCKLILTPCAVQKTLAWIYSYVCRRQQAVNNHLARTCIESRLSEGIDCCLRFLSCLPAFNSRTNEAYVGFDRLTGVRHLIDFWCLLMCRVCLGALVSVFFVLFFFETVLSFHSADSDACAESTILLSFSSVFFFFVSTYWLLSLPQINDVK